MKNIVRALAAAAALAGSLATAATAQAVDPAQRSNTAGYNFGAFLSGSSVEVEGQGGGGFGPGIGFQFGYGFSPHASVFARASVGETDVQGGGASGVTHVDLGLRYSFGGTSSALRPFVLAALNGRLASQDILGEGYARGIGFTGGGGLEYFVSPTVAIDAVLLHSVGVSNQLRGGEGWEGTSLDATSTRIEIGVALHQ